MEIFKLSKSLGFAEKLTGIKICDLSLLAKWLREEYNLHISINVGLPHKAPIMYYSNVIKFGKHHKSKFKSEFYKTYEEAYEIGLQESLKLI